MSVHCLFLIGYSHVLPDELLLATKMCPQPGRMITDIVDARIDTYQRPYYVRRYCTPMTVPHTEYVPSDIMVLVEIDESFVTRESRLNDTIT